MSQTESPKSSEIHVKAAIESIQIGDRFTIESKNSPYLSDQEYSVTWINPQENTLGIQPMDFEIPPEERQTIEICCENLKQPTDDE